MGPSEITYLKGPVMDTSQTLDSFYQFIRSMSEMKKSNIVIAGLLALGSTVTAPSAQARMDPQNAVNPLVEQELRCRGNSDGTWYCEYVIKW